MFFLPNLHKKASHARRTHGRTHASIPTAAAAAADGAAEAAAEAAMNEGKTNLPVIPEVTGVSLIFPLSLLCKY